MREEKTGTHVGSRFVSLFRFLRLFFALFRSLLPSFVNGICGCTGGCQSESGCLEIANSALFFCKLARMLYAISQMISIWWIIGFNLIFEIIGIGIPSFRFSVMFTRTNRR